MPTHTMATGSEELAVDDAVVEASAGADVDVEAIFRAQYQS